MQLQLVAGVQRGGCGERAGQSLGRAGEVTDRWQQQSAVGDVMEAVCEEGSWEGADEAMGRTETNEVASLIIHKVVMSDESSRGIQYSSMF